MLLQDNPPVHTVHVSVTEAHASYPTLHCLTSIDHFGINNEVIHAVDKYLDSNDASFFGEEIAMIKHRWTKFIEVRGDYAEK